MKIIIGLFLFLTGICAMDACASSGRDVIIQKELDCIDAHMNNSVTWSDVCSIDTPRSAPSIMTQPASQTVYAPSQATFTVIALGTPEPTYQWMESIDGGKTFIAIKGAFYSSFTTIPTKRIDNGTQFRCEISNDAGSITSSSVTLTVFPAPLFDRVNTFSLNSQFFYNHFSEPQKVRTETGLWEGLEGTYTFRPRQETFFNTPVFNYYAIEGLYATGENSVKENEEGGFPNYSISKVDINNIPGYMFESRFLIGRDYIPSLTLRLTPYTGLGIRYKTDHAAGHYDVFSYSLTDSPVAAIGYDFSDLYYYIPTGLTIDLKTKNDYQVSLNIEYDFLVDGYERDDYANLDEFSSNFNPSFFNQNLKYTLDHGWGGRSSLKFLKHYPLMDIYLEPYVRYWDIKASKSATGNVDNIPNFTNTANKNSTFEIGSSLGVDF